MIWGGGIISCIRILDVGAAAVIVNIVNMVEPKIIKEKASGHIYEGVSREASIKWENSP